jgi:hypothetical protein
MVAYHSLTVVACVDVTMVTDSIPLWVPVRSSVKRATPHALRYRTTINSPVGAVIRVVWYSRVRSIRLNLIALCCTEKYKINPFKVYFLINLFN